MEERNLVGLCHLDVAFWEDVDTISDELLGNVATVTLKAGKAWSRVYFTSPALFNEAWRMVQGDPVADATITGTVAKDRLALMPVLWQLKGKRCVVVLETSNKQMLLLGDLRTPAMSRVQNRTAGVDVSNDVPGYELSFALTRRKPTPGYGGTPPVPGVPVDCPTLEALMGPEDGATLHGLMTPEQIAEFLAEEGIVEFDGISDEDPYESILISDE